MVYIYKYPKTINYCFEVLNVFTWICCGKILLTFIYSELERSEASPWGRDATLGLSQVKF